MPRARTVMLVTGGTGALGCELLPRLLRDWPGEIVVLTRRPAEAQRLLLAWSPGVASWERVRFVAGDIVARDLGLGTAMAHELRAATTRIVHCAAATSFTLPLEEARAVNVAGTEHVLDFARGCRRLEAIACASTAYVAGTRTGVVYERPTGDGTSHVNSYERSKHEMEHVVQDASPALPTAICRFTTIIGRARDGAMPAGALNAVHHALRLFYSGLAPMIPGRLTTPVDLITLDFAAAALSHVATRSFEPGQIYHLCAGARGSCSLDELLERSVAAFLRVRPAWRKRRVERPAVVDEQTYALFVRSVAESGNSVLRQATEAVASFAGQLAYPKSFDTTNADRALASSGIAAPPVSDFFERVVESCVTTNWRGGVTTGGAAA